MMDEATARYGYVLKRLEAGMIAYRLSIPYADVSQRSLPIPEPKVSAPPTADHASRMPRLVPTPSPMTTGGSMRRVGPMDRGRGEASERNGVADGSSDQAIHEPQGASDAPGNTREASLTATKAVLATKAVPIRPSRRSGGALLRRERAVPPRCSFAVTVKIRRSRSRSTWPTCTGQGRPATAVAASTERT